MRRIMQEQSEAPQLTEEAQLYLSQRNKTADQLVEKWSKIRGMGGEVMEEVYDANPGKIRNLAIALENEERHLQRLTETQISNAFSVTPENVLRILRLGYPNSIRGDIFLDFAMQTGHDSIYYLYPKYGKTKRGATAGNYPIEDTSYRSASEIEDIGRINVLMIPVGGFFTIDAGTANAICERMKPEVIIPMHYRTDKCEFPIAGVDEFLQGKSAVKRLDTNEVELKPEDLPGKGEILVLKYAL